MTLSMAGGSWGAQFEGLGTPCAFAPPTVAGSALSKGTFRVGWAGVHRLHSCCGWQSPRVHSKVEERGGVDKVSTGHLFTHHSCRPRWPP